MKAPCKQIYWSKISDSNKVKALWKDIDDTIVKLNEDRLIELFAQQEQKKPTKDDSTSKPKQFDLLEEKRSRMINIMLGHFRRPNSQITIQIFIEDELPNTG